MVHQNDLPFSLFGTIFHYLALYCASFSRRRFTLPHRQMTNQWNCIRRKHHPWNLEMATSDLSAYVFLLTTVYWNLLKNHFYSNTGPYFPMSFLILLSAPNNGLDLCGCFQKCLFTVLNTISSPQCCIDSSASLEVAFASSFVYTNFSALSILYKFACLSEVSALYLLWDVFFHKHNSLL